MTKAKRTPIFPSRKEFSQDVLNLAHNAHISYHDAIIVLAEEKNIDLDSIKKHLSPFLLEELEYEMGALNMLKIKSDE